jgi:hypothetical protein
LIAISIRESRATLFQFLVTEWLLDYASGAQLAREQFTTMQHARSDRQVDTLADNVDPTLCQTKLDLQIGIAHGE